MRNLYYDLLVHEISHSQGNTAVFVAEKEKLSPPSNVVKLAGIVRGELRRKYLDSPPIIDLYWFGRHIIDL